MLFLFPNLIFFIFFIDVPAYISATQGRVDPRMHIRMQFLDQSGSLGKRDPD